MNIFRRLGLGSAAFGLDYGITNQAGKVTSPAVDVVFDLAGRKGVRVVDTAADYGDSEAVIGAHAPAAAEFLIVTKVNPDRIDGPGAARHQLEQSLRRLRQESVYGLLVHHASGLTGPDGDRLHDELLELKAAGMVEKIGFSAYTPVEVDAVLARHSVDLVQIPMNAIDHRFQAAGTLDAMKRRGIEIHVRSLFLQGLLLAPVNGLPDYFRPLQPHLATLRSQLAATGLSPLQGCLLFGVQNPEVDVMIIGVTDPDQLAEICDAAEQIADSRFDFTPYGLTDEAYINPSRWPANIRTGG